MLVKGVLRADDAAACVAAGAAGVIVSNHGGRQLDRAVPTAVALPAVAAALPAEPVLVDGGIRRAEDALAALALGARLVFLGRPVLWALACGGADGVQALLDGFTDDLAHVMALAGAASVDGLAGLAAPRLTRHWRARLRAAYLGGVKSASRSRRTPGTAGHPGAAVAVRGHCRPAAPLPDHDGYPGRLFCPHDCPVRCGRRLVRRDSGGRRYRHPLFRRRDRQRRPGTGQHPGLSGVPAAAARAVQPAGRGRLASGNPAARTAAAQGPSRPRGLSGKQRRKISPERAEQTARLCSLTRSRF